MYNNNKIYNLYLKSNKICILFRVLKLSYANTTTFQSVTGNKYIGDDKMLDNGEKVPSRQCYCPNGDCGPSGTLNISSCKYGAPAFVSMPHFYLADPSYKDAISGMLPNREKHQISIVIEPVCILHKTLFFSILYISVLCCIDIICDINFIDYRHPNTSSSKIATKFINRTNTTHEVSNNIVDITFFHINKGKNYMKVNEIVKH